MSEAGSRRRSSGVTSEIRRTETTHPVSNVSAPYTAASTAQPHAASRCCDVVLVTVEERGTAQKGQKVVGRVGKNFLAVSAGNLVSRGISFVTVAYLARVLGPDGFGELSWAQAALGFGIIVADWGLQTQGIRVLAERPDQARRTASTYVGLRIAIGLLTATGLAAFGYLTAPSRSTAHLTALYGASVLATALLPEWIFIGLHRMGYVGLTRVLQYVCYAGLVFLVVRGPADILAIPVANAIGLGAAAILLYLLLHRTLPGWRPLVRPARWRPVVTEATPLAASYIVMQLYLAFPILLLGWLRGPSETAFFNTAYRVTIVLNDLLNIFLVALYPVVAERWARDPESVSPLLGHVIRVVVLVTIPLAMGSMVVAGPLLRLLFGVKFEPSVLTFQIIAWNFVLMGINGVYSQLVLLMNKRQKDFLRVVSVGAVVSLLVNAALASRYGHNGAAVAWLISEGAVAVASYYMARHFVTLPLRRHLEKPLIAGGFMAAVCWVLLAIGAPVVAVIACGVVVYGVALILIGAIKSEEIMLFRYLLRRPPAPGAEPGVEQEA